MTDQDRLDAFIRGAARLPVLPKVTVRLLNALDSPDSSPQEIAAIVQSESTLTARLLKLANSPFYGQRGRITSVRNAIVILGSKTIRSLAMAVWSHTLKSHARNADEIALMAPVLGHGLAAGVIARTLTEGFRPGLGEDAFMAGLLHDIGRVALVGQMGSEYLVKIIEPADIEETSLHEMESRVLGFDHRALGVALLKSWALPDFLCDVVGRHHDNDIDANQDPLLAVVALADSDATHLGFNLAPDLQRPVHEELAKHFDLLREASRSEFLETCLSRIDSFSEALA